MTHKEILKRVVSIHGEWIALIHHVTFGTSDGFANKDAILDSLHAVGYLMDEVEELTSK